MEPEVTSASENPGSKDRPGLNYLAWLGPVVVFGGAISYFLFFVQFAVLRDFPWVNLPLVIIGMLLSVIGARTAFSDTRRKLLSKLFASGGLLFSLALGALFIVYIFSLSNLPASDGVAQTGTAAPNFALQDQNGNEVQLADFRGQKLVVTFYRGWW